MAKKKWRVIGRMGEMLGHKPMEFLGEAKLVAQALTAEGYEVKIKPRGKDGYYKVFYR